MLDKLALISGRPYPCTIVADRYRGCYSDALYTAHPVRPEDVPDGVFGDDMSCSEFWTYDERALLIGRGRTPGEAMDDMVRRHREAGLLEVIE